MQRFEEVRRRRAFPGDWRNRFANPLPNPAEPLTLLSFDPYVISWHPCPNQPGPSIYPEDLQLVRDQLARSGRGVILQLSTYDANGNNTQGAVISSVNSVLTPGGFTLAAVVLIPKQGNNGFRGDMMSLVYTRGLNTDWSATLTNLPNRFAAWFRGATAPPRACA